MRKKSLASISLVASLALVLAGCNMPSLTTTQETSMTTDTNTDTIEAGNQIAAAMSSGGTLQCEITNPTQGSTFTYTIKGKKIRVATITGDTTQSNGNMINDTEYVYIWNDGETTGMKMRALTEAEMQEIAAQSPAAAVPDFSSTEVQEEYQNQGYTMTCNEAMVSDTDFVPPTTVTFQDVSAMMNSVIKQGQQMQIEGEVQMQGSQGVGAGTPGYPGY